MSKSIRIIEADWEMDRERLLQVRERVFVVEQKVPAEIEVDELDARAVHLLALGPDNAPIGTARMITGESEAEEPIARIGRVAVSKEWRRHGVGTLLMKDLIHHARASGFSRILIHAQVSSIEFYDTLGFEITGPEFEEAGIAHREMLLPL